MRNASEKPVADLWDLAQTGTDVAAWNCRSTGMELRKRLCAMRAEPLNGRCGCHARMVQGHRTRTIPKRQGYCCDLLERWFYEYRGVSKAYHACCPTRTRWAQRQAKSESRRVACRSCQCASTDNVDTWLVCSSTCLLVDNKTQRVRTLFVDGIFLQHAGAAAAVAQSQDCAVDAENGVIGLRKLEVVVGMIEVLG